MLVLDANILIRAVLGKGVRRLLARHGSHVEFVAPDVAFHEAGKHLPQIIQNKSLKKEPFMAYFAALTRAIQTVEPESYAAFEAIARRRLSRRDEDDWPVLATALALNCPIWTEDTDFFGCGVATWTSDRVEMYLSQFGSGNPSDQ